MTSDRTIPAQLIPNFKVLSSEFVEETAIAEIWKVELAGDQTAALKLYKKRDMGNEAAGFHFLRSLNGTAAANVIEHHSNLALIEWLPGYSLGDLSRRGEDERAAIELVAVANEIHSSTNATQAEYPSLDTWFNALFSVKFSDECPSDTRAHILRCQELARRLLASQHDIRPLHGDLHHDNIRLAERGYCAFDAKGVLGERTYELANAFRNPKGAAELVRNPERVRFLCKLWGQEFHVEPVRLMQWAVAKSALSIVWRSGGVLTSDPEFDLLEIFLAVLDEY